MHPGVERQGYTGSSRAFIWSSVCCHTNEEKLSKSDIALALLVRVQLSSCLLTGRVGKLGQALAFPGYRSVTAAVQRWPTRVHILHHCKQKSLFLLDEALSRLNGDLAPTQEHDMEASLTLAGFVSSLYVAWLVLNSSSQVLGLQACIPQACYSLVWWPGLASQVPGLKVCTTTPSSPWHF